MATAPAGWIAIELRRLLGERVPRLVLLEWIALDPPPPFLERLEAETHFPALEVPEAVAIAIERFVD